MRKLIHYIWLFIKTLLRIVLKPLSFIPALLMMYFIFSFSAQEGAQSVQLSYKVTKEIVIVADKLLDKNLSDEGIEAAVSKYHFYVRKLAHFSRISCVRLHGCASTVCLRCRASALADGFIYCYESIKKSPQPKMWTLSTL